MYHARTPVDRDRPPAELYEEIDEQLAGLIAGERDAVANMANCAALLFDCLPELNWAGFYLLPPGATELVVGPFQGKPACVRIPVGKGVCGTAVAERRAIVVADVDAFPGHIACDGASRSELVIPLWRDGRILGVLDLDSPVPGRFGDEDRQGLEKMMARLIAGCDFP